jgi:hypothetical protein
VVRRPAAERRRQLLHHRREHPPALPADAPAGSPSTPFGLTAATPPERIARSSSASGAVLPAAARPTAPARDRPRASVTSRSGPRARRHPDRPAAAPSDRRTPRSRPAPSAAPRARSRPSPQRPRARRTHRSRRAARPAGLFRRQRRRRRPATPAASRSPSGRRTPSSPCTCWSTCPAVRTPPCPPRCSTSRAAGPWSRCRSRTCRTRPGARPDVRSGRSGPPRGRDRPALCGLGAPRRLAGVDRRR